ncbi:flagellar hook-length control protein FliK [Zobellella maritima]|uniref:flagellar hook-length control protein FliK n=1 Tax=Zobellella maritima TaxID=2059725 RepID=UPI000E3010BD|nr:flagellar hook-length control protein FliK [Zobellella maritima]
MVEISALNNTGPATTPAPAASRQVAPEETFAQRLARHEKTADQKAEANRPSLKKAEAEQPDSVPEQAPAAIQIPPQDNGLLLAMAFSGGATPSSVPVSTEATTEPEPDTGGLPPALENIRQRLSLMEQVGRQQTAPAKPMAPAGGDAHSPLTISPLTATALNRSAQADPLTPETVMVEGAEPAPLSVGSLTPEAVMGDERGGLPTMSSAPPSAGSTQHHAPAGMVTLPAPIASPAWLQQLGRQLVSLALHSDQSIELHLNPAELGPLRVSLKLTEQDAQVQFLSAHGPVRQAVEQAIPQLREALAEQGISLGEASVGEQGQSFAREQAAPAPLTRAPQPEEETEQAARHAVTVQPLLPNGRVDLYA